VTKPVKQAQLRECLARVLSMDAPAVVERRAVARVARAPIRARILVAEDIYVNQTVALLQLRGFGCTADAVANGAEAIDLLDWVPYDLVLMDCQMPELDRYEATRLIRDTSSAFQQIPIIAMTAHALAGDREKCVAAGMDDYITKPVKKAELYAMLLRWLGHPGERPERGYRCPRAIGWRAILARRISNADSITTKPDPAGLGVPQ
jgi:CheY-like chemotaxis protein